MSPPPQGSKMRYRAQCRDRTRAIAPSKSNQKKLWLCTSSWQCLLLLGFHSFLHRQGSAPLLRRSLLYRLSVSLQLIREKPFFLFVGLASFGMQCEAGRPKPTLQIAKLGLQAQPEMQMVVTGSHRSPEVRQSFLLRTTSATEAVAVFVFYLVVCCL